MGGLWMGAQLMRDAWERPALGHEPMNDTTPPQRAGSYKLIVTLE